MKKLLLIFAVLFTLNVYSRTPLITWSCDNLFVSLYSDNKMLVGGILYDVSHQGEYMILKIGDRSMLKVFKQNDDSIVISNVDNNNDTRYFLKCE
jgi:hypothetical protein